MGVDVTCCLDQSAESCYLSPLPVTATVNSEQGHSNETSRTKLGVFSKKYRASV